MDNAVSNKVKKRKRFSRSLRALGCALVIVVLIYSLLSFLGRPLNKEDNTYIDVTIPNGATTEEIGEILYDNGIIGSESNFKFLSRVLMYNNKFKPGFYSLSPSMDVSEIANTLINGITTDKGFTLPAGYTLEQTAEALDQAGFADKEKFLSIAKSGIYRSQFAFLGNSDSIEGFLLPGKYEMDKAADENMIITAILYQFDTYYSAENQAKAASLGLDARQVVILASILEKVSKSDKQMPTIAADLVSRFKAGTDLGALGLTDIPEKPLCSPSEESINAILNVKLEGAGE